MQGAEAVGIRWRAVASRIVVLVLLYAPAATSLAARWLDVGNMGISTDKVMVDTDSIQTVGAFRLVLIMSVYPAPRINPQQVVLDRHVQKTAVDCGQRTFAGIQTTGYLNGKPVGTTPEKAHWQSTMVPFESDATSKRILSLVCSQSLAHAAPPVATPPPPAAVQGQPKINWVSGSGIVINTTGNVLTNNHVVKNCKSILVKAQGRASVTATVDAVDPKNDLALLDTLPALNIDKPALFRLQSRPAKLGEAVGVLGYPLTGILSTEPKATFGQINSVAGIDNDYTVLQISAPVQPGNSGGPVFDASGAVIGVVVSQASLAVVAVSGNVPQNVNFAVRGEVAQIFLNAHGIKFGTSGSQKKLATDEIAARGQESTVLVLCTPQ
jgi:S1-C subfamily serine protease